MCAVLYSTVLHSVLHTIQPLQPLHSPALDWLHTSQHNNNQNTLIDSLTLGGLVEHQGIPKA